jgi:uncharacterized protein YraI
VLGVLLVALVVGPLPSVAQSDEVYLRYAGTELNLREEPSQDAPVVALIPQGTAVEVVAEDEQNGYVPVVYDGITGWAIAIGFVATLAEVDTYVFPEEVPVASVGSSAETRVTLAPLVLRSGPDSAAEAILTMPEGVLLTVTGEGTENGFVTVAYEGVVGWAFAEFLGEDIAPPTEEG